MTDPILELALKLRGTLTVLWPAQIAASAVSDVLQALRVAGPSSQSRLMAVDIALRQLGAVTPWVSPYDHGAATIRLLELRLTEERARLEDLLAIRLPPIPDWRLPAGEPTGPIDEPPCPVLADRREAEDEE